LTWRAEEKQKSGQQLKNHLPRFTLSDSCNSLATTLESSTEKGAEKAARRENVMMGTSCYCCCCLNGGGFGFLKTGSAKCRYIYELSIGIHLTIPIATTTTTTTTCTICAFCLVFGLFPQQTNRKEGQKNREKLK